MNELEAIKRKRLEELKRLQQNNIQEQFDEQAQVQEQLQQLETVVKRIFTKEALERYGNIKSGHPEKAVQLLVILGQAMQRGQIQTIDDEALKNILQKLTPEKKEFKIRKI